MALELSGFYYPNKMARLYVLSIEESLRRPDREAPKVNAILMLCVALRCIAIVQQVAVIVISARW